MELPGKEAVSAIVERLGRLLAQTAGEIGERPLVLPNSEFFPDRFTRDAASVAALVERMAFHAGLDDVPLAVTLIAEEGPEAPHAGGCASGCQVPAALAGTVPRLVDDGDGFTLNVPAFEVEHPVVLTTMIARALGHVFLVEALPAGAQIESPAELTADYTAVALGLGPLLLEGAHIYSKGCGGPSVAQVTRATLPELAVLTAFVIEMRGHSVRRALSELSTTQKAVLSEAHALATSNGTIVQLLREDPERIALGDYRLSDAKPWLLRLFDKKRERENTLPADLGAVARKTATLKPRDPAQEELRALVEESLREEA